MVSAELLDGKALLGLVLDLMLVAGLFEDSGFASTSAYCAAVVGVVLTDCYLEVVVVVAG